MAVNPEIQALEKRLEEINLEMRLREIDSQLQSTQQSSEIPEADEYTLGQRLLQPIRGAAHLASQTFEGMQKLNEVGAFQDAANILAEEEAKNPNIDINPKKIRSTPQLSKSLVAPIEKLAGRSLDPSPEDTLGQVLHTTGEFMLPIPGTGAAKAGNLGIKGISKVLAKDAGTSLGSSIALKATPNLTEEGSLGRIGEDFAKIIAGGRLASGAGKTASYINNLAKSPKYKDALQNSYSSIKDFPLKMAAKFSSIPTKADERIFNLAEKHNVKLPFNVGMNSKVHNFTANTALKSAFISDSYKKALQDADQSMIDAVKKNIDTLGAQNLKPSEASEQFREFLKSEEKVAEDQGRELYNFANESLGKNDKVTPKHTAEMVERLKNEILTTKVKSSASKKLQSVIPAIEDLVGDISKSANKQYTAKHLHELTGKIDKNHFLKKISPADLYKEQSQLRQMINYDEDIKGMERWFEALSSAMEKDMATSSNKEYLSRLSDAKKFYKEGIVDRFRTIMARGIMTGEVPKDAVSMLSSPERIKLLEKSAGDSPKGKEIFDSLKKAKLREILKPAIEGEFETGTVRTAPLAKLFSKSERNEEMIQSLLGKKSFNDLKEVSEIADAFSKANRDLLNTSGSALTHADIKRLDGTLAKSFGVLFGAYGLFDVAGAAAVGGSPYVLSKLVSNPKFTELARQYAVNRARGRDKAAEGIMHKLVNLSNQEVKMLGIHAMEEGIDRGNEE